MGRDFAYPAPRPSTCARFPMSLLGLTVRMSLPIPSPPCDQQQPFFTQLVLDDLWLQRLPRQQREFCGKDSAA